jgi:hypothetical protein
MSYPVTVWASVAFLVGCATARLDDRADEDPGPQDGSVLRELVRYQGDGRVDDGDAGAVVTGSVVSELEIARIYELRMLPTNTTQDGKPVYKLLTYRPEINLVGTPVRGDRIELETVNGNTWTLTGSAAASFFDIQRSEPPAYDPTQMTVAVTALAAEGEQRARVVSWGVVPTYQCALQSLPLLTLSLSNITADHALDLTEVMQFMGDSTIGSGTCIDTIDGYTCTLTSWGSIQESWTFNRPSGATEFDFTAYAPGRTAQRGFHCVVVQQSDLQQQSDG